MRAPGSSGRPVGDDIGRPISTGMLSLQPVRNIGTCTEQLRPSDAGCPIRTGTLGLQPVRNIGTAFAQGSSGHPVCDDAGCPISLGSVEPAQPA